MTFIEAINTLGDSPESVSAKLQEMNIKGYKRQAGFCPIAKYLNACGFPDVTVSSLAMRYGKDRHVADEVVPLPLGVQAWIRNFDDDKYPEFSIT